MSNDLFPVRVSKWDVGTNHGGNPFPGMDSTVEKHRRLGSLASAPPNVNAREDPTFDGGTSGDYFRTLRETLLEIVDELDVISIAVVRSEPCLIRH